MENKKVLKSGIWYTLSNFLMKSIGFITTPIFTRLLTKADFGAYNNYTSWLSIITIFVTLNLEATIISAKYDFKEKLDEYILSLITLSSISSSIWLLIVNLFKPSFENFLGLDIIYIDAMLIYLMFYPVVNLFQVRERFLFEYKKSVLISVIIAIGTALLSVILVVVFQNKLTGRIMGAVIPTVTVGFLLLFYFIKTGKGIKLEYWKYALPLAIPYIPHLLSLHLLNSMDRVMITKFCGSEQTALYSLAYTCGTMVSMLMSSINAAYVPWLSEEMSLEKLKDVRKFSYIYILGFLFFAVGIMLVSPEVLYILGGESYMEAVYVLAPVSMGCVCQFLYTMFVNVEQFKKKTIGMAIGSATAAIVNFVLNLIFIPKIGYLAAAYTTLAGYLVLLLIHMYLVNRLGLKEIYDYKFIGLIVLIGIALMVLITILYSHTILRCALVVVYGCVAIYLFIKYRDKILVLLKKRS